ncbi:putative twin-arginine translocation pathway, signal sequence [Helianthus annuus]|nr:putative twin-arginine translocation pathway, signal sequence [Helianthus annuus]
MVTAAKLLPDSVTPSSLLNSLFNHPHPATFSHSRSFQQPHRTFNTIRASALNRRDFIADTAAAAAALSLAGLDSGTSIAKADVLSEWERVLLPIDPGVVLLDIAFVPDDPSHGSDLLT